MPVASAGYTTYYLGILRACRMGSPLRVVVKSFYFTHWFRSLAIFHGPIHYIRKW